MVRLSVLLVLLCPVFAQATTYYVDITNGSNTNSGTHVDSAWKNLWRANSTVVGDDTVLIRSGTYDDTVIAQYAGFDFAWIPNGGTSGHPITYKGYPGDTRPRIRGDLRNPNPDGDYVSVVQLNGKSNIIFDSLELTNGNRAAFFTEASTGITIRNCLIDSVGHNCSQGENPSAIRTHHCNGSGGGWLVEDNVIFHVWASGHVGNNAAGIQFYFMSDAIIRNNIIYDCGEGIYFKTPGEPMDSNFVYGNIIYETASSPVGMDNGIHVHSDTVNHMFIYNNVLYGTITNPVMLTFPGGCGNHQLAEIYLYNNTIDCGPSVSFVIIKMGEYSGADIDSFYIFNNIFMAPNTNKSIVMLGSNNSSTNGTCNFGKKFYEDYNLYVDTTGTAEYVSWLQLTGGQRYFTLTEWRDTCDKLDATYTCGDNTTRYTSTSGIFVDRANRDYRLASGSPAGTGGANMTVGQVDAPAYRGAYPPTDTTCPTVTLVWPFDNDTIQAYHADLTADFQTDAAGDDIIVTVFGEASDATPDVLIKTDALGADSANWQWEWSGLLEDSTYYWQIIATDTSCADTSSIRHFHVDSIPDVITDTATGIEGVTLEGVQVGAVFDHSEQTFSNEVQTDGRYEVCSATGRRRFACDPDWCAVRQDQ